MTVVYSVQQNCSMTHLNTLGLSVSSRYYVRVSSIDDLRRALTFAQGKSLPTFIMGEGSNVVFSGDYDGLVIGIALQGIEVTRQDDEAIVTAAAGENWHRLVEYCLQHDLYGLENLSLIPGSVGAAPVQNIGAYGVELKEVLLDVTVLDRDTLLQRNLTMAECQFGYRTSVFKESLRGRCVIISVRLKLTDHSKLNQSYGQVQQELREMGVQNVDGRSISEAVCRIRQRKLPDPSEVGNVGSFFKNPVVSVQQYTELKSDYPDLVGVADQTEGMKLTAAWLIDQCGLKNEEVGDAAVSNRHSLVLINKGRAEPSDFLQLANRVQVSVRRKFNVSLELEPTIC
jgi:UDP-N-acetylmuramate dehydrogenase|tara:strand:- start:396 stop:1421 length:1026 start_codon:yes stop_codon:yes gene_type:complete